MEKSYGTDTGKAFQPVFAGTDDCNFIFLPCFCGVCADFVKAHTISRETQELNTALEKVSGYTELFLADELTEDTEVFYDADWQECSKDEASYEIVIRWSGWKAFAWNIYGATPVRRTAGRNLFRWKQSG